MTARRSLILLTAVAAGVVFTPAVAQSTKDRLEMLETSVRRMERMMENNQAIQADLLQRIQALQNENSALRNDVETLQFESGQSGDRQRQLYMDLDQRMQTIEAGGAAAAGAADTGGSAANASQTDADSYTAAFDLLKQGRYPDARAAFAQFLTTYPSSELRDNAKYWLSETYYVTKDFSGALQSFRELLSEYPASRKIPDTLLKIGYCNYELKQWGDARQALSTVSAQYPETTAAKLASQRLAQMKAEGH